MTFEWSVNAAQIQSLFRPWQSGDGYSESEVATAEAALGIRLPTVLREFYHWWGLRDDLTRFSQLMVRLSDLEVKEDGLKFCIESDGVWYWAIAQEALAQNDPPVVCSLNDPELTWQPSHQRLSDFLEYLTYGHAFAGGGMHGGWSHDTWRAEQLTLLTNPWRRVELPSYPSYISPSAGFNRWPLIVRDGCAIDASHLSATGTQAHIEWLTSELHIKWQHLW